MTEEEGQIASQVMLDAIAVTTEHEKDAEIIAISVTIVTENEQGIGCYVESWSIGER